MTDEPKKPPRFRRPSELRDDEVVEVPPTERVPLLPPRGSEPFAKIARGQSEMLSEVLATQRKMALQLDGFGQAMNRRFDIFHEELAMLRTTVHADHAPRIDKVELTMGQKAARGGGLLGIVIVALPLLSDVLPKWKGLFDAILGALQ
jgi:hypothetical protein